jgi:hypothetical protein
LFFRFPSLTINFRARKKKAILIHQEQLILNSTMSTSALPLDKIIKSYQDSTSSQSKEVTKTENSSIISEATDHLDGGSDGPAAKKLRLSEDNDDDDDATRLEAKRAYNRMNSARNRKRQKELITTLKEQLEATNSRMAEMQRENDLFRVQIRLLEQENQGLAFKQQLAGLPRQGNDSLLGGALGGGGQIPMETLLALGLLRR